MPLPKRQPNYFQPQAKAYDPTMRDRAAGLLQNLFGDSYAVNKFSRGLLGSSGLGGGAGPIAGMGLLDMTPLGAAFALEEAGRKIGRGDRVGGVADAALAVVPIPAAARAAKGGAKAVARRVAPKAGKQAARVDVNNLFSALYPDGASPPLDMSQAARMGRATDQGFTKPLLHGTAGDHPDLLPSRTGEFGGGVYTTTSPVEASGYAGTHPGANSGPNIRPLLGKINRPFEIKNDPQEFWDAFGGGTDEQATQRAIAAGFDGVSFRRPVMVWDEKLKRAVPTGETQTHVVAFDPSSIRSRFDPFNPGGEARIGLPRPGDFRATTTPKPPARRK